METPKKEGQKLPLFTPKNPDGSQRVIKQIMVIDPNKIRSAGLDLKMAEALKKSKGQSPTISSVPRSKEDKLALAKSILNKKLKQAQMSKESPGKSVTTFQKPNAKSVEDAVRKLTYSNLIKVPEPRAKIKVADLISLMPPPSLPVASSANKSQTVVINFLKRDQKTRAVDNNFQSTEPQVKIEADAIPKASLKRSSVSKKKVEVPKTIKSKVISPEVKFEIKKMPSPTEITVSFANTFIERKLLSPPHKETPVVKNKFPPPQKNWPQVIESKVLSPEEKIDLSTLRAKAPARVVPATTPMTVSKQEASQQNTVINPSQVRPRKLIETKECDPKIVHTAKNIPIKQEIEESAVDFIKYMFEEKSKHENYLKVEPNKETNVIEEDATSFLMSLFGQQASKSPNKAAVFSSSKPVAASTIHSTVATEVKHISVPEQSSGESVNRQPVVGEVMEMTEGKDRPATIILTSTHDRVNILNPFPDTIAITDLQSLNESDTKSQEDDKVTSTVNANSKEKSFNLGDVCQKEQMAASTIHKSVNVLPSSSISSTKESEKLLQSEESFVVLDSITTDHNSKENRKEIKCDKLIVCSVAPDSSLTDESSKVETESSAEYNLIGAEASLCNISDSCSIDQSSKADVTKIDMNDLSNEITGPPGNNNERALKNKPKVEEASTSTGTTRRKGKKSVPVLIAKLNRSRKPPISQAKPIDKVKQIAKVEEPGNVTLIESIESPSPAIQFCTQPHQYNSIPSEVLTKELQPSDQLIEDTQKPCLVSNSEKSHQRGKVTSIEKNQENLPTIYKESVEPDFESKSIETRRSRRSTSARISESHDVIENTKQEATVAQKTTNKEKNESEEQTENVLTTSETRKRKRNSTPKENQNLESITKPIAAEGANINESKFESQDREKQLQSQSTEAQMVKKENTATTEVIRKSKSESQDKTQEKNKQMQPQTTESEIAKNERNKEDTHIPKGRPRQNTTPKGFWKPINLEKHLDISQHNRKKENEVEPQSSTIVQNKKEEVETNKPETPAISKMKDRQPRDLEKQLQSQPTEAQAEQKEGIATTKVIPKSKSESQDKTQEENKQMPPQTTESEITKNEGNNEDTPIPKERTRQSTTPKGFWKPINSAKHLDISQPNRKNENEVEPQSSTIVQNKKEEVETNKPETPVISKMKDRQPSDLEKQLQSQPTEAQAVQKEDIATTKVIPKSKSESQDKTQEENKQMQPQTTESEITKNEGNNENTPIPKGIIRQNTTKGFWKPINSEKHLDIPQPSRKNENEVEYQSSTIIQNKKEEVETNKSATPAISKIKGRQPTASKESEKIENISKSVVSQSTVEERNIEIIPSLSETKSATDTSQSTMLALQQQKCTPAQNQDANSDSQPTTIPITIPKQETLRIVGERNLESADSSKGKGRRHKAAKCNQNLENALQPLEGLEAFQSNVSESQNLKIGELAQIQNQDNQTPAQDTSKISVDLPTQKDMDKNKISEPLTDMIAVEVVKPRGRRLKALINLKAPEKSLTSTELNSANNRQESCSVIASLSVTDKCNELHSSSTKTTSDKIAISARSCEKDTIDAVNTKEIIDHVPSTSKTSQSTMLTVLQQQKCTPAQNQDANSDSQPTTIPTTIPKQETLRIVGERNPESADSSKGKGRRHKAAKCNQNPENALQPLEGLEAFQSNVSESQNLKIGELAQIQNQDNQTPAQDTSKISVDLPIQKDMDKNKIFEPLTDVIAVEVVKPRGRRLKASINLKAPEKSLTSTELNSANNRQESCSVIASLSVTDKCNELHSLSTKTTSDKIAVSARSCEKDTIDAVNTKEIIDHVPSTSKTDELVHTEVVPTDITSTSLFSKIQAEPATVELAVLNVIDDKEDGRLVTPTSKTRRCTKNKKPDETVLLGEMLPDTSLDMHTPSLHDERTPALAVTDYIVTVEAKASKEDIEEPTSTSRACRSTKKKKGDDALATEVLTPGISSPTKTGSKSRKSVSVETITGVILDTESTDALSDDIISECRTPRSRKKTAKFEEYSRSSGKTLSRTTIKEPEEPAIYFVDTHRLRKGKINLILTEKKKSTKKDVSSKIETNFVNASTELNENVSSPTYKSCNILDDSDGWEDCNSDINSAMIEVVTDTEGKDRPQTSIKASLITADDKSENQGKAKNPFRKTKPAETNEDAKSKTNKEAGFFGFNEKEIEEGQQSTSLRLSQSEDVIPLQLLSPPESCEKKKNSQRVKKSQLSGGKRQKAEQQNWTKNASASLKNWLKAPDKGIEAELGVDNIHTNEMNSLIPPKKRRDREHNLIEPVKPDEDLRTTANDPVEKKTAKPEVEGGRPEVDVPPEETFETTGIGAKTKSAKGSTCPRSTEVKDLEKEVNSPKTDCIITKKPIKKKDSKVEVEDSSIDIEQAIVTSGRKRKNKNKRELTEKDNSEIKSDLLARTDTSASTMLLIDESNTSKKALHKKGKELSVDEKISLEKPISDLEGTSQTSESKKFIKTSSKLARKCPKKTLVYKNALELGDEANVVHDSVSELKAISEPPDKILESKTTPNKSGKRKYKKTTPYDSEDSANSEAVSLTSVSKRSAKTISKVLLDLEHKVNPVQDHIDDIRAIEKPSDNTLGNKNTPNQPAKKKPKKEEGNDDDSTSPFTESTDEFKTPTKQLGGKRKRPDIEDNTSAIKEPPCKIPRQPEEIDTILEPPPQRRRGRPPKNEKNVPRPPKPAYIPVVPVSPLEKKYKNDTEFNPRLLLIRQKEELKTDTPISDPDLQTVPKSKDDVQCALCMGYTTKKKWLQHISSHYGIGWRVGTPPPLNVKSRASILNYMVEFFKLTKVKGLNCRLCQVQRRSALGLLVHLEQCCMTEDELKDSRVECEHCNNNYSRTSIVIHLRACPALLKSRIEEKKDEEKAADGVNEEDVLSNTGRLKRRSVIKAEHKFKNLDDVEFLPDELIKHIPEQLTGNHPSIWGREILSFGKAFCVQRKCPFTATTVEELQQHCQENVCSFFLKPGYLCIKCKFHEETIETVRNHVVEHHKPRPLKDFDDSGDEAEFGSESSSDSGSSGDDEDENEAGNGVRGEQKHRKRRRFINRKRNPQKNAPTKDFKKLLPERQLHIAPTVSKWTEKFIKKNYSKNPLFTFATPSANQTEGDGYESHFPKSPSSMKFILNGFSGFVKEFGKTHVQPDHWQNFKRLQGIALQHEHTMYVGGPVKSIAWVPLEPHPPSSAQYLATATRKGIDKFTRFVQQKLSRSLIFIQKYNISEFPELRGEIHYAFPIDQGPVHCIEFLPSGGYAPEMNRLGLLAVATVETEIKIYSLPLEVKKRNCDIFSIIRLEPSFVLALESSDCANEYSEEYQSQCTCVVWSQTAGHNYIIGGYLNGYIAIWDISDDDDNLNRFVVNGKKKFVPVTYFWTMDNRIKQIAAHYDMNGLRWLAICNSTRKLLLYDLREISKPVLFCVDTTKNICNSIDWPIIWENLSYGLGDAMPSHGNCINTVSPMSLVYIHRRFDKFCCGVNDLHFNAWKNIYAAGADNGDVHLTTMREAVLDVGLRMKNDEKVISTLDIVPLNGNEIGEQASLKLADGWRLFETDYKEKYGLVFGTAQRIVASRKPDLYNTKRIPPLNMRRLMRVNRVRFNPNRNANAFLAVGYDNGLLRVLQSDWHKKDLKDSTFKD